MKKNIVIAALLVVTGLSLAFAYQQKKVAEDAKAQLIKVNIEIEKARVLAEQQAELAKRNMELAQAQYQEAVAKTKSEE